MSRTLKTPEPGLALSLLANSISPLANAMTLRAQGQGSLQGPLQDRGAAASTPAWSAEAAGACAEHRPVARRSKLWELGDKHHCPVIGTCLGVDELQRLARRFKFQAASHDAFALHVEAVSCCHQRNPVAEWVQRHLDEKYRATLSRWSSLTDAAAVLQQWQRERDQGAVAAALWAAYTHKHSNSAIRQALYADIHMLSHQVGAGLAADVRRLNALEAENQELKQQLAEVKAQAQAETRCDAARIVALEHALEKALNQAQTALQDQPRLQARLAAFENGQVTIELGQRLMALEVANERLRSSEARLTTQLQARQAALQTALATQASLARAHDAAREEVALLSELLSPPVAEAGLEPVAGPAFAHLPGHPSGDLPASLAAGGSAVPAACAGSTAPGGPDCAGCPAALSPRCVLYVGGRAAMIQQYRQLAARLGVELLHHDGGQEEALSRLPELIHGADAVVCPTDHVSHSAYYQVKAHCKRSGKPCLFYKGGGVSSFAVAMGRLARGQYSLAGASIAQVEAD